MSMKKLLFVFIAIWCVGMTILSVLTFVQTRQQHRFFRGHHIFSPYEKRSMHTFLENRDNALWAIRILDTENIDDIPYITRDFSDVHHGIDVSAENKTSLVLAAADGVVLHVQEENSCLEMWCKGMGNVIVLGYGDEGASVLYAHLDSFSVQEGDEAHAGDALGVMGSTGRSTGSHVHFQVCSSDCADNGLALDSFVDPKDFFSTILFKE